MNLLKLLKFDFDRIQNAAADRGYLTPPEKREIDRLNKDAEKIQDEATGDVWTAAFELREEIAALCDSEMAAYC